MSAQVDKVPFDAGFEFDTAAWCRALARPTKMMIVANPSNPVGCRLDGTRFRTVIESARPDTLLIFDEAYYEFASDSGYPNSLVELARRPQPWLVLRTFSKAYGLAGCGWGTELPRRPIWPMRWIGCGHLST